MGSLVPISQRISRTAGRVQSGLRVGWDFLWNKIVEATVTLLLTDTFYSILGPKTGKIFTDLPDYVKILVSLVVAGSVTFLLSNRIRSWALLTVEDAVDRYLASPQSSALTNLSNVAAEVQKLSDALANLINDVRTRAIESAPRFVAAAELLARSNAGSRLIYEIESLSGLTGRELTETLFNDHAILASRHSVIVSMSGYLQFLERIMDGRNAILTCVNKTLPIEWFAPWDESEEFIHAYVRMACRDSKRIKRITVLAKPDDLLSQFQTALAKISHDDTEAARKQRFVWMISLALPTLAIRDKLSPGSPEQRVFETYLSVMGESVSAALTARAAYVYGAAGVTAAVGQNVFPQFVAEDIWSSFPAARDANEQYLGPFLTHEERVVELAQDWSRAINKCYFELLGKEGAYWGTHDVLKTWLGEHSLGRFLARSSEIGAFQLGENRLLAFHAQGDLTSGVRITFMLEPQITYNVLTELFAKIDQQRAYGATTAGIIGYSGAN